MTSQGCCPVLVEGLPAGNQTVPAGGNSTFSGIPANTQVTLTAQTDGNCTFEYWWVDEGPSTEENPYTLTMNSDHTAEAWCSSAATPTPTPTPSGYTLTVTSQGCCSVLVSGLPGGDQPVPVGGSMTFTGITYNTLVHFTAQPVGDCKFDYWVIDGVPNHDLGQTIPLYIRRDRTMVAVCVVPPPVTLTVTSYDTYLCPIIVSGLLGGDGIVNGGATIEFTGIPANTVVTLSQQTGYCGPVYSWWIDGVDYPQWGQSLVMDVNHTVLAYGGGW